MKILGIDIGGSAIKGAPVDTTTGVMLTERFRIETPDTLTPLQMARAVAAVARHFHWRGRIGVGFPGVIHGSRTLTSANLHPRFVGLDTGALFARETGCRVAIVNDADAAGLAEMRFGAGRGVAGTVLLLTLGTGVGSALFHDGCLMPNTEFGHLTMRGRSAERFVSSAARKRRELGWDKWGQDLNRYLLMLETLVWPDRIILGGGVSAKSGQFFRYLKPRADLVPAELRNGAGIIGAALWAREQKMRS